MPNKSREERMKIRVDHPDSWIAVDEGDVLIGKIVDVTDAWSDQRRDPVTNRPGSLYPLLTIDADEATGYENPGELKVHGFGAVLFNEIMRKRPNIGERVQITYQGTGTAKPGQNPPERYTLRAAGTNTMMAQSAYANIGRSGRGQQAQGASAAPVQTEDFAQGEIPGADEDIPF